MSDHDTIIPPALPTETDNSPPEPDVMRVGGLVLKRTSEGARFWIHRVDMPAATGDASLFNQVNIWSAEFDYVKNDSSEAVKATAQRATPEEAIARARAIGNFPPEFFEALSKEIEP